MMQTFSAILKSTQNTRNFNEFHIKENLTQMKASIKKVILSVLVADDGEDETHKLIIICVFLIGS